MTQENREPYFPYETRQQPDAIRGSLAATESARKEIAGRASDVDRVLLTGSGDSFYLGQAVVPAFERLAGIPTETVEAYDLVSSRSSLLGPDTLLAGISASGKSVRTLQAVEMASRAHSLTTGVTNASDSPLARASDIALTTAAEPSYTFPTKTTTTALAVLAALAADTGVARGKLSAADHESALDELREAVPRAIEDRLATDGDVSAAVEALRERRQIFFVGSGASRGSALVGAAKVYETCRRPATAINAEEYLHLMGFSANSDDAVVVIASDESFERERQAAQYASRQGAMVIVVADGSADIEWPEGCLRVPVSTRGLAPWSGALVEVAALHMIGGGLSRILGRDPDRPENVDLDYVLDLLYTSPLPGW